MNFLGIDLHKQTITVCVVDAARQVRSRRRFFCARPAEICEFFRSQAPFRAVVEATASYHWLVELLDPIAERVVLAHPRKLRIIAESTRKSDRLDAQVLAEFLALEMIPVAYRPTPRQRQHRSLVRQRQHLRQRLTATQVKIRRLLGDYNADVKNLFTRAGLAYLATVAVSAADRFVLDQLLEQWQFTRGQLASLRRRLEGFAAEAPPAEAEQRRLLRTITGIGAVTAEVILSELGDVARFGSHKKLAAYAGLAPGQRESAGKVKGQGITKEGSGLLRWALVEASWQLVRRSGRWREIDARLKGRRGSRKAIVAVARRLLGVVLAVLRDGREYDEATPAPVEARAAGSAGG
jgi:transposase